MESDTKIRLRHTIYDEKTGKPLKDDEGQKVFSKWRYALTVARNGYIMSSTHDTSRAGLFTNKEVNAVSNLKQDAEGVYRGVEIETF